MESPLVSLGPQLRAGRELTGEQVAAAVRHLIHPATEDAERAEFLIRLTEKGETANELAAFARTLLIHAVPIHRSMLPAHGLLLDCCGTGGGGLPLFNVSTAILFILAAAGVPVVKHGNRGITKPSGSADVMEALGLDVELTPEEVGESLSELGFAFLYAPAFHPAFRIVAPVRKKLAEEGRRTVFNLLGPLLNPLLPETRLVGVFKPEHVELYHAAFRAMGVKRSVVVYGRAGEVALGEVSPTGENLFNGIDGAGIGEFFGEEFRKPHHGGLPDALFVQDAKESAALIGHLLTPGVEVPGFKWGRALLIANAGVAMVAEGQVPSFVAGCIKAREILQGGAALAKLTQAREWTRRKNKLS